MSSFLFPWLDICGGSLFYMLNVSIRRGYVANKRLTVDGPVAISGVSCGAICNCIKWTKNDRQRNGVSFARFAA